MNDVILPPDLIEAPSHVSVATTKPSVSVFGLGYVGAVSVACLAELGHRVVGVDVDPAKVDAIAEGRSPIAEEHLGDLLDVGVSRGLIDATADARDAVLTTDISFVSVGTPTAEDGGCDYRFIRAVARAIGSALAKKSSYHLVVMRCSIPPGTTREILIPALEAASGKAVGSGFGVAFNPEFIREGCAVRDFFRPTKTVIGANDVRAIDALKEIYAPVDTDILVTSIDAAEMVKYVDNTWHATKVAFANEVGRLSKSFGIDSHDVMNIFVQDRHLNLSSYYLRPGFAYGGSCLPKEVRAMQHLAEGKGIDLPLIGSLTATNDAHIAHALDMIERSQPNRVGFLGVTFKSDTDDLRESPTLELVAACLARGIEVKIYDPNLRLNASMEDHYAYMRHARPHLRAVMDRMAQLATTSAADLTDDADVIVVSHATDAYRRAVMHRPQGCSVIDLARLFDGRPADPDYHGIGW